MSLATLTAFTGVEQKFVERTELRDMGFDSECWMWTAYCTKEGYGRFAPMHGLTVFAHRWSYQQFVEPIFEGYVVDHLCRVRACCNPTHLEQITPGENVRRGHEYRQLMRGDFCKHNHFLPLVGVGADGYCKQCRRDREKRYKDRQKAKGVMSPQLEGVN